jgi:hypothetical protein
MTRLCPKIGSWTVGDVSVIRIGYTSDELRRTLTGQGDVNLTCLRPAVSLA